MPAMPAQPTAAQPTRTTQSTQMPEGMGVDPSPDSEPVPALAGAALHGSKLVFDRRELERSWWRGRAPRVADGAWDRDYLLHCRLVALFGDEAPKPFFSQWREHRLVVEGRGRLSAPELWQIAWAKARRNPDLVAWFPQTLSSQPVVQGQGEVVDFEIRLCPIVRLASSLGGRRAGAEVDAYERALLRLAAGQEPPTRERVYGEWLRPRLANGGAELLSARMQGFALCPVLRRSQKTGSNRQRQARHLRRPVATLVGRLRVSEPVDFRNLLERGLGRHKAFGFGLLRLKEELSDSVIRDSRACGSR